MRLSSVLVFVLIVGGGAYFGWKEGYFGQMQKQAEQSFNVHYSMGMALYQTEKYLEAIPEFERAIALQPLHAQAPEAMIRIGNSYRSLQQPEKAVETYQKLLHDYPNCKLCGKAEQAIELIRGIK